MGVKKNIRKIIFICFWLLAGTGIIVLLIAAVNSRSHQVCKGYDIKINGAEEGKWFVSKNDIIKVITSNKSVKLKDRAIKSFDLNSIETKLKKEVWVKDAELFFDNNGILKVNVRQREPVARIFNSAGESFYIDSSCRKLPLSAKMTVKLPVFTGYPFGARKTQSVEKRLLNEIKTMSMYLMEDPFWMAQVAQVDITPAREFELVPTVGNHLVEFGNAKNMDDKFKRLMVFYQQVLAKTGMEKYERIKVQYDQQVIGVKKTTNN